MRNRPAAGQRRKHHLDLDPAACSSVPPLPRNFQRHFSDNAARVRQNNLHRQAFMCFLSARVLQPSEGLALLPLPSYFPLLPPDRLTRILSLSTCPSAHGRDGAGLPHVMAVIFSPPLAHITCRTIVDGKTEESSQQRGLDNTVAHMRNSGTARQ